MVMRPIHSSPWSSALKHIVLVLATLGITSCCIVDHGRRIMYEQLAPARLVEETLYIHCEKNYAEVRAVFHLKPVSSSTGKSAINFPGNAWPLRLKGQKNFKQGSVDNFSVRHNGQEIDWFEENDLLCFVIDFSPQNDTPDVHILEFSYTSPYLRHENANLLGYVLPTGSLWKGSIGILTMQITHHPDMSITVLPPYTASTTVENIRPKWDVGILVQ